MSAATTQFVCYVDELGFYIGDANVIADLVNMPVFDVVSGAAWSSVPFNFEETGFTLISARDVQDVWGALRMLRRRHEEGGRPPMIDQTIFTLLPCGMGELWMAFDDVPWHDTPCPCGDPRHQILRYTPDADKLREDETGLFGE